MSELTFGALQRANYARFPFFKNRNGELAHSKPDGSDWTPAQWLQAVIGELGEYANVRKKFERGDINECQFLVEASKELADVQCYLSILASQIGIDLGQAVKAKWNEVSERIGCAVELQDDDWYCFEPDEEFWSTPLPRGAFRNDADHQHWNSTSHLGAPGCLNTGAPTQ